ncbi:MAG: heat-inducible transcription repressor HrcA [Proteobacteria bacterium]|nr:heat-inducible transcription repressor HrcA [Pseudomonadota bacterium]
MNSEHIISERSQQLLKLLIEQYIRDGQPVASQKLATSMNLALSPASIRNVLSELEDLGYLRSPHTSAGRIPTPQGYRFFVNSLLKVKTLDDSIIGEVQQELTPNQDKQSLLQTTSSLLSRITQLASVVTLPKNERMILRHVEFLPLSENRVLVILVLNEKEVQNRIIQMDRSYQLSELEQASNFLNQHFSGKDMVKARAELLQAMQRDRQHMDSLMQTIINVAEKAFPWEPKQPDYVLSGQMNLLDFADETGVDQLRSLFKAFVQKQEILELFDHCLEANGLQIFIGEESGYQIFDSCSLITAPYSVNDHVVGVLGVIGPTRIAYEEIIPIVDVTAKLLSAALN